jgi:hypothetical protein
MAEGAQSTIAEIIAQAKLTLDDAIQRGQGGEPLGSISSATMARLQARADTNSGCNTSCHPREA